MTLKAEKMMEGWWCTRWWWCLVSRWYTRWWWCLVSRWYTSRGPSERINPDLSDSAPKVADLADFLPSSRADFR